MNITNSTPYGSGENKELIGVDFSTTPKTPFRFSTLEVQRIFNVKFYGAKGDGVTDDTQAIQTTINAVAANIGGTVFFPKGIYIVSSPIITSSPDGGLAPNSQLYIPAFNLTDNRGSILLLGESSPSMVPSGPGWANLGDMGNTASVIIKSTLTSNTSGYILGSGTKSGGVNGWDFNAIDFCIENIAFESLSDSNGAIMGGIDAHNIHSNNLKNVAVFANHNIYTSSLPTRELAGIYFPKTQCNLSLLENFVIVGFKHGLITAEHCNINQGLIYGCDNGITLNNSPYFTNIGMITLHWNKKMINSGNGRSGLIANMLEIEVSIVGKWYDSTYCINDPSNQIYGQINYRVCQANAGINNSLFNKNGGTNLNCNPL